jgi:predicted RNA-binding protein Jag
MKKMTEKEKTIQLYMSKLDLSHEEAEQMWLDEQEDNLPELTPEQKAVAKEMAQADRKKESTPRKRERKPDAAKRQLIDAFVECLLCDVDEGKGKMTVDITNPERELEFDFLGERYRLTLSKPRKEKSA